MLMRSSTRHSKRTARPVFAAAATLWWPSSRKWYGAANTRSSPRPRALLAGSHPARSRPRQSEEPWMFAVGVLPDLVRSTTEAPWGRSFRTSDDRNPPALQRSDNKSLPGLPARPSQGRLPRYGPARQRSNRPRCPARPSGERGRREVPCTPTSAAADRTRPAQPHRSRSDRWPGGRWQHRRPQSEVGDPAKQRRTRAAPHAQLEHRPPTQPQTTRREGRARRCGGVGTSTAAF